MTNKKNIINILTIDSSLYKSKTYHSLFNDMSNFLMNHFVLYINDEKYQLVELEYYLKDGTHDDPFIHHDKHQSILGKWYFHRQFGKMYKSGTYKGLDITFGYADKNKKCYGGILIRSIKNIKTNEIIEGPCKIVNLILKNNNEPDISSFVKKCQEINNDNEETVSVKMINNKSLLYLKYDDNNELTKETIYSAPRVGLTLKKYTKEREGYLMNNYRFINNVNKIKKFKSGIVLSLWKNNVTNDKIKTITSTNLSNIKKYIDYAIQAKNDKIEAKEYNGKKLNVKDLCVLQSVCDGINLNLNLNL